MLHGAGVGSGVFAASDRAGDLENSFSIGGYTRLDASLWYALNPKIRLSLNMKNLTDEYYVESSVSQGQIAPGEGRSVLLSINGSF